MLMTQGTLMLLGLFLPCLILHDKDGRTVSRYLESVSFHCVSRERYYIRCELSESDNEPLE